MKTMSCDVNESRDPQSCDVNESRGRQSCDVSQSCDVNHRKNWLN